jgi:flagellar protein FlaG
MGVAVVAQEPEEVARIGGVGNIGSQGSQIQSFLAGEQLKGVTELPVDIDKRQVEPTKETDIESTVNKVKRIVEILNPNIEVRMEHYPEIKDITLSSKLVFYDKENEKVIKEVPPQKALEVYAELLKKLNSLFVDTEV